MLNVRRSTIGTVLYKGRSVIQWKVVDTCKNLILVLRGMYWRKWKVNFNSEITRTNKRRLNADCYSIRIEVTLSGNFHSCSRDLESGGYDSAPEVKHLFGIGDFGFVERSAFVGEADAAEVDSIRITNQPLRGVFESWIWEIVKHIPTIGLPWQAFVV